MASSGMLVELSKLCVSDSERWFAHQFDVHSIPHHALALAGEVGEFANIVKKIERGDLDMGSAIVFHNMSMELTDAFIYLLNIAGLMKIDLEAAFYVKRADNERRFGRTHPKG